MKYCMYEFLGPSFETLKGSVSHCQRGCLFSLFFLLTLPCLVLSPNL